MPLTHKTVMFHSSLVFCGDTGDSGDSPRNYRQKTGTTYLNLWGQTGDTVKKLGPWLT